MRTVKAMYDGNRFRLKGISKNYKLRNVGFDFHSAFRIPHSALRVFRGALKEPVPVKGKYEVIITFTKRINKNSDSGVPDFEAFKNEKDALEFCNNLAMGSLNETW